MRTKLPRSLLAPAVVALAAAASARADIDNLKIVTDASPDYSDMASLVHSITSNWQTDKEKCWALFYWNHIARRQTNPMIVHGLALTDPIRQFNDYGYTMCSTISGNNCSIWDYMGYPVRYYDVAVHTVPEVFYENGWHMYDNSLSAIYTLCDGKTIAGVQDLGKTLGCPASGGKEEPGHIVKYHCLNASSANGFLEGADTFRDLQHLGEHTFKPEWLKYRSYYNDADRGHRYILNLRENEVYERHYRHQDELKKEDGKDEPTGDPAYFISNGTKKDGSPRDPEGKNPRYGIRGNGVRTYQPSMTLEALHSSSNLTAVNGALQPAAAGKPAEAVFKVEGANVIASLKINANLLRGGANDQASIAISTTNGNTWQSLPPAESGKAEVKLRDEVNGAYEVLVKVSLLAKSKAADVQLKSIRFEAVTEINGKTQPQLKLGANTVYVGAGEQTESIVIWPELQGDKYKPFAVESVNIKTKPEHEGWNAVMNPAEKGEGYVVFKVDAPQDITRITQSARMSVKAAKSEIGFEHSLDGGRTWIKSYAFSDTKPPYDDIHDQVTPNIPAGVRSVLFKYVLKNAGLFAVRMEVNHKTPAKSVSPVEVTFNWSERQEDYSLQERSYTQLVDKLPAMFRINVGGADHPVVNSLVVNTKGARGPLKYGYSDGRYVGGEKFVGKWVAYGKNLAEGKPYTATVQSDTQWGAGDPDGKILTDGVVGATYEAGIAFTKGVLYRKGTAPEVTIDLGRPTAFAAVRAHIHGYPGPDAIKGEIKDRIEVLTSNDGSNFKSEGEFNFNLRWKDIPVNFMWPDDERFKAYNHTLVMKSPVEARFVKFKITPARQLGVTELQVLDSVKAEPFDLRIALPDTKAPAVLTTR